MLSKKEIFSSVKLKQEVIDIKEWGGGVIVQELTSSQKDAWEISILDDEGKSKIEMMKNYKARFAVLVVVDQNGARIFSDGDHLQLGQQSASIVQRVWETGKRLCALDEDEVEEILGN